MHRYTDRLCSNSIYNWIEKCMFKSVKPTTTIPTHMWLNEFVTIIFNIILLAILCVYVHMIYKWCVLCFFFSGLFFLSLHTAFSFLFKSVRRCISMWWCMIKTFLSPCVQCTNSLDVHDRCKHILCEFIIHLHICDHVPLNWRSDIVILAGET